ncbi:MAG: hypothetical protein B7X39_18020 [Lysobacterales bacterium 14-68-21]|jgi:hypothetical protein|nr:MAG: hypothetical protein B7X45_15140 [Xanthomonadales bacterium 15-68-25]OZB63869.1 MAG: hypothetical protein B7X39_18020 [Xanthomonadales bacterium 14-68-21]
MISHSETVESIFGYWPEFADGRIELFSFEWPGIICLRIAYIDSNTKKAAIVSLRFSGVTDIELSELHSENIVDVLSISSEPPNIVTIESCYGLCGTFKCTAAEVTGVVSNHSFKADGFAAA